MPRDVEWLEMMWHRVTWLMSFSTSLYGYMNIGMTLKILHFATENHMGSRLCQFYITWLYPDLSIISSDFGTWPNIILWCHNQGSTGIIVCGSERNDFSRTFMKAWRTLTNRWRQCMVVFFLMIWKMVDTRPFPALGTHNHRTKTRQRANICRLNNRSEHEMITMVIRTYE